jgi:hypothetical protein
MRDFIQMSMLGLLLGGILTWVVSGFPVGMGEEHSREISPEVVDELRLQLEDRHASIADLKEQQRRLDIALRYFAEHYLRAWEE